MVLLETARRTAARAVNAVMTATYWEIGRRIVEVEQRGGDVRPMEPPSSSGSPLDLTKRFGRGSSRPTWNK